MGANNQQVGGSHYASRIQHWDMAVACRLGYFEGQITKYLYRWRKKNGLEDLDKALHFLDKLIENWNILLPSGVLPRESLCENIFSFLDLNGLMGTREGLIIIRVVLWYDGLDLRNARKLLVELIDEERSRLCEGPGTPEDGGHHSKQELER